MLDQLRPPASVPPAPTDANFEIDAVVAGWSQHVYYFTAYARSGYRSAFLLLLMAAQPFVRGQNTLAARADDLIEFQGSWDGTQRQDQPAAVAALVLESASGPQDQTSGPGRSAVSSQYSCNAIGCDGGRSQCFGRCAARKIRTS